MCARRSAEGDLDVKYEKHAWRSNVEDWETHYAIGHLACAEAQVVDTLVERAGEIWRDGEGRGARSQTS